MFSTCVPIQVIVKVTLFVTIALSAVLDSLLAQNFIGDAGIRDVWAPAVSGSGLGSIRKFNVSYLGFVVRD